MNFFKLYIGDYLRDTGTLTLAEHGAYHLMLLEHYAREKPLPKGRELYRLLRAETKGERDAIDSVLRRFWTETEDGYINQRALKEFGRAAEISNTNREIALAREAKKRANKEHGGSTKRAETVPRKGHGESTNQTPDTNISTTGVVDKAREPRFDPVAYLSTVGVPDGIASDWLKLRKAKKAAPTKTAIEGIEREAAKAGVSLSDALATCCTRAWVGFNANWDHGLNGKPQVRSLHDERRETINALTGRTSDGNDAGAIVGESRRLA